jgi:hypothetical protein
VYNTKMLKSLHSTLQNRTPIFACEKINKLPVRSTVKTVI